MIERLREAFKNEERAGSASSGDGDDGGGITTTNASTSIGLSSSSLPLNFTCPVSGTRRVWSDQKNKWEVATDK